MDCYKNLSNELKNSNGEYLDCHAWKFTSASFPIVIDELYNLNFITLPLHRCYHTVWGRLEFCAVFWKQFEISGDNIKDAGNKIEGHLDQIISCNEEITFLGWGILTDDSSKISDVILYVDSKYYRLSVLQQERMDVVNAFHKKSYLWSGFLCTIRKNYLKGRSYSLFIGQRIDENYYTKLLHVGSLEEFKGN